MKNDAGEPTLNSTILERMFHLWKLRLLLVAAVVHIVASTDDEFSMYPTHIRKERLRRDENGKNVETGKLESIGGISKFTLSPDGKWIDDKSKKVTYSEFKKRLQCSPSEPGLNIHGTISLIRELVPLDDQVFEIACAFAESSEQCTEFWGRFDWDRCTKFSVELKGGKVSSDRRKNRNPNVRLIRVINGRLYYDWPWKPLEKPDYESQWGILRLLGGALEKISDMKDSVFISTSFDFPLLPPNVPVPSLSHGPKIHNSDIPFPWTLLVNDEIVHYQSTISAVKNFIGKDLHSDFQTKSIDMDLNPDNDTIWLARENKAAHHGTLWFTKESVARQIVMDLAVKRPDMIAANWTKSLGSQVYYPRKPGDSRGYDLDTYLAGVQDSKLTREIPLIQYMARYKYLLVLSGMSSSERLSTFMAYSGAVILLQQTDILYHFSPRLKPWVHYVPISYTAADILDKIRWLRMNDDKARQLARNARLFARSYLRLEDYYCYAAAALHTFGTIATPSALTPHNPQPIPPL